MRFILMGFLAVSLTGAALGQKVSVTTAPAETTMAPTSEVEDLIARLHALEAENELLRAQLSSLAQKAPASAPAPKSASVEKPINGIEGLMQGFPKEQMPTVQDPKSSLRYSLLERWVKEHTKDKSIVLRARFGDADSLNGESFVIRVGSGKVPQWARPFEATVVLPASEANTVLPLHTGDAIDVTGHIQNADVLQVSGLWVVFFELDGGTIEAVTKPK